jgi:signal transduction histidine kinase
MTESSLSGLFTALDIAVLQRAAPDTFFVHGTAPGWLRRVNARWKDEREVLASRTFPFLDHFLGDAEAFWAGGEPGRIGSGLSTESGADGAEFHYEAWAVTAETGQFLLLEYRRDGAELQSMLQRAREGLLERERLERAQRALERSTEALRKAKAEAEAGATARAALLTTISHEVRTPVHAIIGLAGLLQEASLPPGQRRFLAIIRSSSETLLAVLNDMLDASRLEIGALAVDERPFDVRRTLDEALDVVAVRAAERGVDLCCQVDLSVPEAVVGDVARVRQILINLLSNAVKFTPSGDVFVVGEAQDKGDGRIELHVAVRDEGPGISVERLAELLAMPAPDALWSGRAGMGLAICRSLAQRMGGRLWADVREGRGSTFHFTVMTRAATGGGAPYLRSHQPLLEKRRAWVIGCSPATEQLLINQCRFWGMETRATRQMADVAGWVAGDGLPDAIIADRTRLDDAAGLDLLAAPIVELVTLARAHDAAGRPVTGLLTKPVRASRLYTQLTGLLAASGESPAAG